MNEGRNFLNSISQFIMTDVGTIIKCGPQICFFIAKYAKKAIACIVFPSPYIFDFIKYIYYIIPFHQLIFHIVLDRVELLATQHQTVDIHVIYLLKSLK